ncbi:MAG: hypothetical protein Q9162_002189 [Coniocarpon cinnabarinum]
MADNVMPEDGPSVVTDGNPVMVDDAPNEQQKLEEEELKEDQKSPEEDAQEPLYTAEVVEMPMVLYADGQYGREVIGSLTLHDTGSEGTSLELVTINDKYHQAGVFIRVTTSFIDQDEQHRIMTFEVMFTSQNVDLEESLDTRIQCSKPGAERSAHGAAEFRRKYGIGDDPDISNMHVVRLAPVHHLFVKGLFGVRDKFGSQTSALVDAQNLQDMISEISMAVGIFKKRPYQLLHFENIDKRITPGIGPNKVRQAGSAPPAPTRFKWRNDKVFSGSLDFASQQMLAAEYEAAHELNVPHDSSGVPARFFEVPNAEERYFVYFDLPEQLEEKETMARARLHGVSSKTEEGVATYAELERARSEARIMLRPGTKINVNTNPTLDLPVDNVKGRVVDSQIINNLGVVVAVITSRWNKDTKRWEAPHFEAVSPQLLNHIDEAKAHLLNSKSHYVNIVIEVQAKTWRVRRSAFHCFYHRARYDADFHQKRAVPLLGNTPNQLPTVDFLGGFRGPRHEVEALLAKIFDPKILTPEQNETVRRLRHVPAGYFTINGAAGTGKSWLLRRVIAARVLLPKVDGTFDKVLVPVSRNGHADAFVRSLKMELKQLQDKLGLKYHRPIRCLRAFNPNSEMDVFEQKPNLARPRKDHERPGAFEKKPWSDNLDTQFMQYIANEYQKVAQATLPAISNRHIHRVKDTVGYMMVRYLGLANKRDSFYAGNSMYLGLKVALANISKGIELSSEAAGTFKQ